MVLQVIPPDEYTKLVSSNATTVIVYVMPDPNGGGLLKWLNEDASVKAKLVLAVSSTSTLCCVQQQPSREFSFLYMLTPVIS